VNIDSCHPTRLLEWKRKPSIWAVPDRDPAGLHRKPWVQCELHEAIMERPTQSIRT
jgi:hypothetical protein